MDLRVDFLSTPLAVPLYELFIGALIAFDGAKLTGERIFDVGASSSSVPGNGTRKLVDGAVLNSARELVGV
jgi:hypothetical protein